MLDMIEGCENWTEADREWVAGLQETLQPVAIEYGRRLFVLVMQTGQIGEALAAIGAVRHDMVQAAGRQVGLLVTQLVADYLSGMEGDGMGEFVKCKAEVERVLRQEAPRIQLVRH